MKLTSYPDTSTCQEAPCQGKAGNFCVMIDGGRLRFRGRDDVNGFHVRGRDDVRYKEVVVKSLYSAETVRR